MGACAGDTFLVVKGFTVEVAGPGGTLLDEDWESASGGALSIMAPEAGGGGRTPAPGPKSVDEVVLRGPMTSTPQRADMTQWIMDTVKGTNPRRNITIREILGDGTPGRTFTYEDCFPTGYTFPKLDASSSGAAQEEVKIKATRLTVS